MDLSQTVEIWKGSWDLAVEVACRSQRSIREGRWFVSMAQGLQDNLWHKMLQRAI